MNLFDVFIFGIVNFCLIRGIFRGLIEEGVSLIGVIVGFFAAGYSYDEISKFLSYWITQDIYSMALGFFSVFLGIAILIKVLIPAIKYILGLEFISGVDTKRHSFISKIRGRRVRSRQNRTIQKGFLRKHRRQFC